MKKMIAGGLLLLVGCGVASSPATPTPDCISEAKTYHQSVEKELRVFDDTVTLASKTARINLAGPIGDLQSSRRTIEDITIPDCAQTSHTILLESLDTTVEMFLDFAGRSGEVSSPESMLRAATLRDIYSESITQLTEGSYPADPTVVPGIETSSLEDILSSFESMGYKFKDRTLSDGGTAHNAEKDGVRLEIIETPSGDLENAYVEASKAPDLKGLEDAILVLIPTWNEAQSWIAKAAKSKTDLSIGVGGLTVSGKGTSINVEFWPNK